MLASFPHSTFLTDLCALLLHQMAFALLTPIAIEPVIPEPDPSLVMLGLGWAKQVAGGVNRYNSRRAILSLSAMCSPERL